MTLETTGTILAQLQDERLLQGMKWGEPDHHPVYWLAILTEEIGEIAQCVCKFSASPVDISEGEALDWLSRYREELVQAGAVIVAMLESFDRNEAELLNAR